MIMNEPVQFVKPDPEIARLTRLLRRACREIELLRSLRLESELDHIAELLELSAWWEEQKMATARSTPGPTS